MIKAVLIDVDNTLLDFNKCAASSIKAGFEKYGIEYNDGVFPVFERVNDSLWLRIEQKTLTIDELHKIRWNMIFNELGIDRNGSEFELLFVENIHESCIPVDGALDLVKYLSEKYIVCVASNASYNQQKNRLTKAGMFEYFKELFVSKEIGFPKPTKEYFDICLSKLSPITKDETIMIGDSLSADIEGGVKYGMKTCWYNHNNEKIPPDLKADFTVSKLSEIKNIL